jgi:hypothetical protein
MHVFLQILMMQYLRFRTAKLQFLDSLYTAMAMYLPYVILRVFINMWTMVHVDCYKIVVNNDHIPPNRVSKSHRKLHDRWQWACKYSWEWKKLDDLYHAHSTNDRPLKICTDNFKLKIHPAHKVSAQYDYYRDGKKQSQGSVMFNDIEIPD